MATTKTVLVLANSNKHYPCTCIAGREIRSGDSRYTIEPWVRPVSSHDEGGISPSESRLQNGRQPAVMDFVELPLSNHTNDALQPENWLIQGGANWRSVNGQFERPALDLLLETPRDLWYQRSEQTDRASSLWLRRNPPTQSLYLIYVPSLTVRFGWRVWDGRYKARRRALFRYNAIDYDLTITDPVFLEAYRTEFPEKGQRANEFEVVADDGCYLCVSLAPEFNGYHYKVVATIIEA